MYAPQSLAVFASIIAAVNTGVVYEVRTYFRRCHFLHVDVRHSHIDSGVYFKYAYYVCYQVFLDLRKANIGDLLAVARKIIYYSGSCTERLVHSHDLRYQK